MATTSSDDSRPDPSRATEQLDAPAAPTPDDKNWTWVLERTCPECGFDASTTVAADVSGLTRANVAAWRPLLEHPHARRRPTDDQWSALEYACHVRDVFRLFDERLQLMLAQDDPLFANWDQDVTAVADRYDLQDPVVVVDELEDAGERLARRFEAVSGEQWTRTGVRSDGAVFTVDSFARYFIHDPVHHLDDVRRGHEILDRTATT